jgi:hypothetical protein
MPPSSSWFVLAIRMNAAAVSIVAMVIISGIAIDEQKNVEAQTVSSSNINPVVALDGTGKGTITCSNNESDNSSSSSSSSSAQITLKALGYPRGTYADIIGGDIARLYSTDIGTTGGANISMEGSTGSGSIYSEGFTLQIEKAIVKCPSYSIEDSSLSSADAASLVSNQNEAYYYMLGDVLISGKCGNSVQFFAKDITQPFQLDGTFRGDVLCVTSPVKLTDICSARTGRDSDGDSIDDICDPTPFPDFDGDNIGDQRYELDNCPSLYNPDQSDRERNGIGDACDLYPLGLADPDGDFVGDRPDEKDNCPYKYNPDQKDKDHDGIGDQCDPPS